MSAPSPNSPTVPPPTPSVSTPPSPIVSPAPVSSPPTRQSSPPPTVSSPPPQSSPPQPSPPPVTQSPPSPPLVVVTPSSPPAVPTTPSPPPTTPSSPPPVPSPPPPDTTTPSPVPVVSSQPPPAVPNAPPPSSSPPPSNAGSSSPPPPPRRRSPSPPNQDPSPPPTPSADPPASSDPPAFSPPPPSTIPTSPPSPGTLSPPPANNNTSSSPVPGVPTVLSPRNSVPGTVPSTPSSSGESSPNDSTSGSSSGVSKTAVLGIALGGLVAVVLLVLLVVCCTKKNKKRGSSRYNGNSQDFRAGASYYKDESYYDPDRRVRFDSGYSAASDANGKPLFPPMPPPSLGHAPTRGAQGGNNSYFSYEELAQATNGFSRANMLGEGGFGCVYKGILPGGQEVAVKQLKVGGGQGEREFRAEVEIITRIHHRHLVTLVGYCISETQRLLVYEFVPNGTLEHHLHGKGRPLLDWSLRVKIAIGSARGLAYLHEDCHPKIIHRDIKSSNILIDSNFEAQVADFGLAKLASDAHTHVTTRVMGTFGYLAPEYASSGKLTDKSDVYSFGVVLLELITGRKPVDTSQPLGEESLVEWTRPLINQAIDTQDFAGLADPMLNEYDKDEMLRMLRCAAACVRHSANKRPKMLQIVRALESESGPGFSGIHDSPFASEDYDSTQYSSDLRRFRKMALGGTSQEYGSEYSGATSEYGVNPSVSSGEFQRSREYASGSHESEWPLRSRQI